MPATNYLVKVKTGSKDYGGTDAKVNIELIGAARTHRQRLDDPNNDDFEKGHLDAFRFATEDVGWLEQIKISHDDSGDDAGWYVEYVEVHNQRYGIVWRTSFDRWLASDEGDKKTTATAAVPVSAGTVEADRIVRQYLGYQVIRRKNDSSAPLAVNEKFSNSFKKGLSMTTSEARSVSVKAAIDATFFGAKCSLDTSMTATATKVLGTTQEQVLTLDTTWSYVVAPKTGLTVIVLYYQDYLAGEVIADNVAVPFKDKFLMSSSTINKDGILSDNEVQLAVDEFKASLAATAPVAMKGQSTSTAKIVELRNKIIAYKKHSHAPAPPHAWNALQKAEKIH